MEAHNAIKHGNLVELSEQNLLDCTYGSSCNGGYYERAFNYVRDNNGIDTETSYRYKGREGYCNYSRRNKGASCKGYSRVTSEDEDALKQTLGTVGPVAIAIDASQQSFKFYNGGIYDDEDCSSDNSNHAVLAIGYGQEDDQEYWLIKNSWGERWGDNGYIRIKKDGDNFCGVASEPAYPVM